MSAQAAGKPDFIPSLSGLNSGIVKVVNDGKAESRTSWLTIMCVADCPEHPGMATYKNPKFPNAVAVKVPALKPGESFKHQLSFWKNLQFKPGIYKFVAMADAGKDIPESNELNNKTSFVKKVKKLSASNKFKSPVKSER